MSQARNMSTSSAERLGRGSRWAWRSLTPVSLATNPAYPYDGRKYFLDLEKGTRTVAIDLLSFGPERFSSRELSRLEFGSRLLDLGEDQRLPILERFKFVAIFADMVDEFFQVRVVSLEDKVAAGVQTPSVDGIRPRQQLEALRERVLELAALGRAS